MYERELNAEPVAPGELTSESFRWAVWGKQSPNRPPEKQEWDAAADSSRSYPTPEMGDAVRRAMLEVYGLGDLYYEPMPDLLKT